MISSLSEAAKSEVVGTMHAMQVKKQGKNRILFLQCDSKIQVDIPVKCITTHGTIQLAGLTGYLVSGVF